MTLRIRRLCILANLALAAALPGRATTAVSNITGSTNLWWNLGPLSSYESFTVGNEAATLQGFSFGMSWSTGSTGHVDLHSSNGTTFGNLLATTPTHTFATSGYGTVFIPTTAFTLEANTTYFIHFVRESGTLGAYVAETTAETGLPGWSIGDRSWLVSYNEWSTGIPTFAVETSAVPEPSTAALALGAAGLAVVLHRRRRSASRRN